MKSEEENYGNVIVAWAKHRKNYVKLQENVAWHIKDGTKFGRSIRGNLNSAKQDGLLFESKWFNVLKLRPRSLEIVENPNPVGNFVDRLRNDQNSAKIFLNNLFSLRVDDAAFKTEDICFLLEHADNLAIFEFSDADSTEMDRILESLRTRNKLKAINFQCSMNVVEMHKWMKELKLKIRLVRFCGQPGFKHSEFMKIRDEFPCVELLALQDFQFCSDDENQEQIDPKKFFNKISYVFPNLKMLYFDWRVVDTVCIYDDFTKSVCEELQRFYKNAQLQFVALLIYCPSEEMKQSVKSIQEFLQKENEADQLVVRVYDFNVNPELEKDPNFSLLVFGEYHYQNRTKRLIEVVVDGRETNLDLRHFSYIVDMDNLLDPDVVIEFGGFDSDSVEEKFRRGQNDDYFVTNAAFDRCFTGSTG